MFGLLTFSHVTVFGGKQSPLSSSNRVSSKQKRFLAFPFLQKKNLEQSFGFLMSAPSFMFSQKFMSSAETPAMTKNANAATFNGPIVIKKTENMTELVSM